MTMFWVAGGLFVLAALLFLLPPLFQTGGFDESRSRGAANLALYREKLDQVEHDVNAGAISVAEADLARREIERQFHEDIVPTRSWRGGALSGRWTAVALGIAIPLAATLLYRTLGNPQALGDQPPAPVAAAGGANHALDREKIAAMVDSLAARLRQQPGDLDGWIMLGRSYAALGRYEDSAQALRQASGLKPDDPGLLADLADILAMARGKRLAGEPYDLARRALALDPRHLKALSLAASAEFEAGNNPAAIAYWERIAQLVPEESRLGQSVRNNIAEAGGARRPAMGAGQAVAAAQPAAGKAAGKADAAAAVSGRVRLADALRAGVAADDVVFVFARAAAGQRMPLAIRRLRVADLPYEFTLDDSAAVMPGAAISSASSVVVAARISRSGSATPQKGDLIGTTAALQVGTRGIDLVIDRAQE